MCLTSEHIHIHKPCDIWYFGFISSVLNCIERVLVSTVPFESLSRSECHWHQSKTGCFNFSHLLFCYKILCPLSKVINQVTFLCVTWVIWSLYSCLMSDERKLLFCYLFFYISTQFKKYTGRHYSCEKSFGKWLIFCLPVLTKIGESAEMITVITGLCWDEDVQQDRVVFGCCAAQYRQNKDLVLEMNQSCSDFID